MYALASTYLGTGADGGAHTAFLSTLNSGGCFAGQCDWRLPTLGELQTLLLEEYPCTVLPCIDETIFGPAGTRLFGTFGYWSSTTQEMVLTGYKQNWITNFLTGELEYDLKSDAQFTHARAVRGGL